MIILLAYLFLFFQVGAVILPRDTGIDAASFKPVRPPAIPLAVRSPYLSAWLRAGEDGGNGGLLAGKWPSHWRFVNNIEKDL
jgi:hypothetical protein